MSPPRISVLLLLVIVSAVRSDDIKIDINGNDAVASGLKFVMRLYDDCTKRDGLSPCLKMKAISFFDRVSRTMEIPLTDSLVLVKTGAVSENSVGSVPVGRSFTESELEATLAKSNSDDKDMQLNKLLLERVARFFNSYKVQIAFPKVETNELQRSIEEGRGKMKKMMGMMMMGAAMKAALAMPLMMGGLFLLVTKALIVSKVALVLALIIALKKLMGGKQGGGHSHGGHDMHHGGGGGGWQSSGGGGGGWDRRSLDTEVAAHQLAYKAQIPTQ